MKKTGIFTTLATVAFVTMMVGCSKVPEQELATAKAMLDSAKTVEADKYMSGDFSAAQDSLNVAITEIEKQKSANALSRNFDRAKSLLLSASAMATHAKALALEEKQKVKVIVDTLLAQANELAGETDKLLAQAPKGKEGKAALEAIGGEITTVKASIADAQTLSGQGDLITARDKANAGITKLNSIKEELNTAIQKAAPKQKTASKSKKR
jgi:hypothetical protein